MPENKSRCTTRRCMERRGASFVDSGGNWSASMTLCGIIRPHPYQQPHSHATAHGFLPPPMRMRPAGFLHPPAIFADGVTTLAGGDGTARTPPSSRFGAANPTGDSLPPPLRFCAARTRVSGSASGHRGRAHMASPSRSGCFCILTRDQFARPSDHAPGQREAGKAPPLIETGENGKIGCFAGIFDHFLLLRYRFSGFPVSIRAAVGQRTVEN